MADTKKEALFNEVKGSLFEYLVARKLASEGGEELDFLKSLDQNYLTVLSQQDRMVRQFYPEMIPFLDKASASTVSALRDHLQVIPKNPRLMGKLSNDSEVDLLLSGNLPVSLKLNKKNAFVNTKSGGIKSFFAQYFPYLPEFHQQRFNQFVDREFEVMAARLHEQHEMEFHGSWAQWVKAGNSELPGELGDEDRQVLKAYYARIALEMHRILAIAAESPEEFGPALAPLTGFRNEEILQVVCFHSMKETHEVDVVIHPFSEIKSELRQAKLKPFSDIASVEVELGSWELQIRVKPMNKFTTTAIKINCSVKVTPPSGA